MTSNGYFMTHIKTQRQNGTADSSVRPYETKHRKIALKAAAEGIVLLKNEGLLPLPKGTMTGLFGSGARKTVKGGTGSGNVNERESISIEQGMEMAGFQIADKTWMDTYDAVYQKARLDWKDQVLRIAREENKRFIMAYFACPFENPEENKITEEMAKKAKIAVYVISRISGEGADRRNKKGDFQLSDREYENLKMLQEQGCAIVLVLNTGGLIDLSFLDELPQIKAVLYVSQGGMEGGTAVGQVLCGEVNPSGKLSDTWANHYEDWPCANSFGANNGDLEKEYYREGILVGYRWFDRNPDKVRYPFGFGLSYTSFLIQPVSVKAEEKGIQVAVQVKNTGDVFAGKEVVQVYVAAPKVCDVVRESKKLAAFAKTSLLKPGEEETVLCEIPYRELARFDEDMSAWVVDEGRYEILVGNCADRANKLQTGAVLYVEETCVLEAVQHICRPKEEIEPLLPEGLSETLTAEEVLEHIDTSIVLTKKKGDIVLSRAQIQAGNHAANQTGSQTENQITNQEGNQITNQAAQASQALESKTSFQMDATQAESDIWMKQAEEIADKLTQEQMIRLVCGLVRGEASELGTAALSVPGAAGQTVGFYAEKPEDVQLESIVVADGPAGLRLDQHYQVAQDGTICPQSGETNLEHGLFEPEIIYEDATMYYQYCTAFPIGTMLAQTWNTELIKEVGRAVSEEMELFHVALWLAPGMNIHRNPLCGRNFEYYSEDPLLTGKIAAAITLGVQEKGKTGTTIKHFACNSQEDNRMGVDSILSERALREIYLKGFEIAVKESQPFAIMTSYNLVNGVHSANSTDLCTQAARKEWGFKGLIMTDWTTTGNGSESYLCIKAGNDLIMPGMVADHENIRAALKNGELTEAELRACVCRIVRIVQMTKSF
ncbi:MAG: glycoside hydrolase family 3 C-terminal domain-containing protein [bacterium]|nr:glycoside hydrolase family 3 C-terminal domain-containing protein [bacterium]